MFVVSAFLVVIVSQSACFLNRNLGGIFYQDSEDLKMAFTFASEILNFTASIKEVKRGEILQISQHVCSLAEEGVIGIIDATGGRTSEHVQAVCDILELPHVVLDNNDVPSTSWSFINMFPSPLAFNDILLDLVELKDWKNFTILYAKGNSILQVIDLMQLQLKSEDTFTIAVRELDGDDYRDVLIDAKQNGYVNFVVDCPSANLELLLLHAQQVGLMAEEHSYIFVSPDLFTLDLDRYRYGGVNMTGFRLMKTSESSQELIFFTDKFRQYKGLETLDPQEMKTNVILIYDAIQVFDAALQKMKDVTESVAAPNCKDYSPWMYGSTLLNYMKTNTIEGLSNSVIFDGDGHRSEIYFDVVELSPAGSQTVGHWDADKLIIDRPFVPDAEIGEQTVLRNKTLKVLIALVPPYAYEKESKIELAGNDRYEGFAIELIDKLSDILGFNYEFDVEEVYGGLDKKTQEWTGMLKQLREETADLAICDLTITAERQSGIEFSTPFMTLGISILYKEPSKQPPELFSFMAVFSKEVWYNMLLIQMGLGLIMIFVGRISHKEWQNPVPCIEQPEELSNQFSFANSIWLIIGSVMQQGSEIAPIALAPRMITSVWWFFTMVMVASYVGTLVAFLTVEKDVLPFNRAEDLYHQKSISYGAKDPGSTLTFFMNSSNPTYKNMYNKMVANKWLVGKNDDGVAKAENSTYAFFMESTSIEYYTERHCDLLQIGGLLDSKSYGIGMKKKSLYKKYIDDALLQLKENGELQKLKDLWWKEKRGGGNCLEKTDEEQKQLGLKNMLGAYVVLGAGCLVGLFISTLDMLWGVFKRSVKYGTTFKFELIEELKFVIKFSGTEKPVKRKPKITEDSVEALAEAEGKDEIKSLKSIHSGRSTDTHRTHRSHCSRHSSRSLSIAFAKRRSYS